MIRVTRAKRILLTAVIGTCALLASGCAEETIAPSTLQAAPAPEVDCDELTLEQATQILVEVEYWETVKASQDAELVHDARLACLAYELGYACDELTRAQAVEVLVHVGAWERTRARFEADTIESGRMVCAGVLR